MKIKRISRFFPTVALIPLLLLISCGAGDYAGFNAPYDATVILPDGTSVEATAAQRFLIDVVVKGNVKVYDDEGNVTTKEMQLPGIQVQLNCFYCTIYDKTNGADYISGDSPIEEKASPYIVKTNKQGFYQFLIEVPAPAEVGLTEVEAQIGADIGVDNTTATYTITAPTTKILY